MPKRIPLTLAVLAALLLPACDPEDIAALSDQFGCDPTTATTQLGPQDLDENNTTLQDATVTGIIVVDADNITISNVCLVASGGTWTSRKYGIDISATATNVTIEDTDITGPGDGTCSIAVYSGSSASSLDITNTEATGCEDGFRLHGGNAITGNLVHTLDLTDWDPGDPNKGPHADAIQIRHGDDFTITGNILLAPYRQSNAALQLGSPAGPTTNLEVTGNYLSGGNVVVNGYGTVGGAIYNNTAERDSTRLPKTGSEANNRFISGVSIVHYGNVWHDGTTETPID